MKRRVLNVTNSALLQYLECQWQLDIEGLRKRIAREATIHESVTEGSCAVRKNRNRFEIIDGSIVAVTRMNPHKPRRRK